MTSKLSLKTLAMGSQVRINRSRIGTYQGRGVVRVEARAVDPMGEVIESVTPGMVMTHRS